MSRLSPFHLGLAAALALTLGACNTTSQPKMSSANVTVRDQSAEGLAALNKFRASHGLGPVVIDANLIEVAKYAGASAKMASN
ncbi:MAG: hypothetical protein EBU34_09325 [Alphaproteobacteria bacterium]|nr:hypothetical protein [Alphaproteobacteria bacterium]